MIEIFYLLIIIVFGALNIITLFSFWQRGSFLNKKLKDIRKAVPPLEQKRSDYHRESQTLDYSIEMLKEESRLQMEQEKHLKHLEEIYQKASERIISQPKWARD